MLISGHVSFPILGSRSYATDGPIATRTHAYVQTHMHKDKTHTHSRLHTQSLDTNVLLALSSAVDMARGCDGRHLLVIAFRPPGTSHPSNSAV